jgi:hypothetical protein
MSDPTTLDLTIADVLAIDADITATTDALQYGITPDGFVPKPFARLLAEKLALSRAIFGESVDLSSGSVIRKLLEVTALEDARTWAALAAMYDNSFVASARGEALSRLGDELGLTRPYLEARGSVKFTLLDTPPTANQELTIPRGARLSTPGGHHVSTDESVTLSPANKTRNVAVVAFYPGPEHNLDPTFAENGIFPQKIDRFNLADAKLEELSAAEAAAGKKLISIDHTARLSGGELQWPDARYRQLLLRAPRSVWSIDAIQTIVSLVPGVRQVRVFDGWGGLDINQSIFGNFNFIERVFSRERDLGSPYYFTVLIAPTPSAIRDGPDGLEASVASFIEDLRPIGIFPNIEEADEVFVGIQANLVVRGLPLPSGSRETVNNSQAAADLRTRLVLRVRRYIEGLQFGDLVRASEIVWALMNEPGIADVQNLVLLRSPASFESVDLQNPDSWFTPQSFDCGLNITMQVNQIATFVENPTGLVIS